MAQTVVGLFKNETDAQTAIDRLQQAGISRDQVDLSRGSNRTQSTSSDRDSDDNGITRFFKSLFGSDSDDADRYSKMSNSGYSVVTVHAQSNDAAERAADILDNCGAANVDENARGYASNRQGISSDRNRNEDATIERVEENLEVGKREVEGEGVRVRSRIIEKPVEENIRLREEHVRVDRQDVNRPVTDSDRSAFQDQDIELTERSEIPVVNKEARVVEEIKISKDVSERTETVHDTVRNTEVDVDKLEGNNNDRRSDWDNRTDRNDNNSRNL